MQTQPKGRPTRKTAVLAVAACVIGALLGVTGEIARADQNEQPGSTAQASITAGHFQSCAIVGPAVRCWGYNAYGQLGLGNTTNIGDDETPTTNVNLGNVTATATTAGGTFACVLLTGGAVRCWGFNGFGQLGLGNNDPIGDNENPTTDVHLGGATATAVAAGAAHTCALLTGGAVRCWGNNAYGQLGLASTTTIGDNEDPTVNVNLGGATATAITTGAAHTCALLTGGAVRCWGYNAYGQLGLANTTNIGDNENPTFNVNLSGATATAITAGEFYTCALLTGGAVRCWGYNAYGQLGLANTSNIGDNETPITDVNLGNVTATAISAGEGDSDANAAHTCALLTGGAVRCWGGNDAGQLGIGNTTTIGDNEDPTVNVNLGGATATAVATGGAHTCAVLTGGGVRCWGLNSAGQLGLGNTTWIGDNENPITNVANTSAGPDALNPTVFISTPTANQFVTTPVAIQGNAADRGGIVSVALAIYRNVAGGQYWNGAAWQAGNTTVPATLISPNSVATVWNYSFNSPPGGVFAVAAISYDPTGNYAIAPYQTFKVVDATPPGIFYFNPAPNEALTTRPVTIDGVVFDNAGIGDVQIAIYRPVGPGQFWNGTTWQTAYTTVTAALGQPGNTFTNFTYDFNPPQTGGLFYTAVIPLDTSYNYYLSLFTPFTLPDPTPPTATITTPVNGATTSGAINITGTATDNNAIAQVGIAIYRASTSQYFNGTTWQAGFATIPATTANPGNTTTTFTATFTPPTPGYYLIAALPIDGNYNYALTAFNTINAT